MDFTKIHNWQWMHWPCKNVVNVLTSAIDGIWRGDSGLSTSLRGKAGGLSWFLRSKGLKTIDVFGPFFSSGQCAYPLCHPETMITPTRFNTLPSWRTNSMDNPITQRRGLPYQGRNTCDAKGQAWRRNPSGKPTNEEKTRRAGLFRSQDCWNKDRDHWPFLSTHSFPV